MRRFPIILTGFRAVGKTTLGKALAKELNEPFYDLDALLANQFEKEFGRSLTAPEIFDKCGPYFFRQLEYRALLNLEGQEGGVIALGGGTLVYRESRKFARYLGKQIYLFASKKTLWERNVNKGLPRFLNRDNFNDSVEIRDALFRKDADEIANVEELKLEPLLAVLEMSLARE